MVNVRPYAYAFLALAIVVFIAAVMVGLSGSPTDVFFLLTSIILGALSFVTFRKYREDKKLRRF
jgi:hypothetical protein